MNKVVNNLIGGLSETRRRHTMYSEIPREWRHRFDANVTIEELNNELVKLHIPTIIFIIILMIVGIIGNVLVLCVYTNFKSGSSYKSFIIWLGWMDLIECVVLKPGLLVSMFYPYMFPSEALCRASRFLHVAISVGAAFIFLAISYERYKKICFMDMHQMSNKRVNLICFGAVIAACLVAVPALFVFGDAKVSTGVHNINGTECFIDPDFKTTSFPKLYFFFQLLLCLMAFGAMCVFYLRIGRTLKWHRSFVRKHKYERKRPVTMDSTYTPSTIDRKRSATNEQLLLHDVTKTHPGDSFVHPDVIADAHANGNDLIGTPTRAEKNGGFSSSVTSLHRILKMKTPTKPKQTEEDSAQNIDTKEITKMMFIVTIVFILAFLPHLILIIINATKPGLLRDLSPVEVAVYNIFLRTFVINNMANPIVYYICLTSFRTLCADKLRSICCFICRRRTD